MKKSFFKRRTKILAILLSIMGLSWTPHLFSESAVKSAPPKSILDQIQNFRKTGQLDSAKALAMSHLAKNPRDSDITVLLGYVYYQQKNYPQAELYFKKTLALAPHYLDAELGLVRIKIAQGKIQEASSLFAKARRQDSKDPAIDELSNTLNKISKIQKQTHTTNVAKIIPKQELTGYNLVKSYYNKGNFAYAKFLALDYLNKYPQDGDVRLVLGQILLKEKCYPLAKKQFQLILASYPKYTDARLLLVDVELIIGDDLMAQQIVDQGLQLEPCKTDLLAKQARIVFAKHMYAQSAFLAQHVLAISPCNAETKSVLEDIKEVSPRYTYGLNEVGISSANDRVPDVGEIWDYSSLYYTRDTSIGSISARMNYASRLGYKAPQAELDFLPVVNKNLYFEFIGTYANQPVLFPNYQLGAEGFLSIPTAFDVSLGEKYSYITTGTYFNRYTGSLSKEINNYWLSFRPYYFVPNNGSRSLLYTGTIRRYLGTTDRYINLTFGMGKSPDLADLETANFLVIKNKYANLGVQFPVCNHRFVIDLGIGYQRWNYPTGLIRNLYGANAGIKYRF